MISQPWVKCRGLDFEGIKEALVGFGLGVLRLDFVLQSSLGCRGRLGWAGETRSREARGTWLQQSRGGGGG